MNNNATRLLATAIIWIATAAIFIYGFFDRLDIRGEFPTFMFCVFGIAIALSPAIATRAIWNAKIEESNFIPQNIPWRKVGTAIGLVVAVLLLARLVRL